MSQKFPLNSKQDEAVIYDGGPMLVLAGAGSGKTRVLTRRIVYFIREKGVSPWRFFAVTFTNKAAREMKRRIVEELGPEAESLWVSTFHSSSLRILRRHAEALNYERSFAVYDTSDQAQVMKAVLQAKEMDDKTFKPQTILGHIDRAKNAGVTPENFVTEGDYFLTKVKDVYDGYQKELLKNQAMDFGDLILNAILLFRKRPDILAEYQNQFQYVLIDEYQDTNPVQYELIKMLAGGHKRLFVVGDDDQSIYKFRGAEIKNILNFQRDYPEAKIVRLEQNYRSTGNILTASNAVIRKNSERLGKELWTENGAGEPITVFSAATEKDEAVFVAGQIAAMRDEFSLNDFAVFYRTNAQSRGIEDELRKRRIAYRIFGGMKFYERAEVKDMMAYLRLIVNRADAVGLKRVLNVPARGIGKTSMDKVDQAAQASGITFWEVLQRADQAGVAPGVSPSTANKMKSFCALIDKMAAARADLPLDEFLPFVYEQTGYWQMLTAEKSFEAESRKENLNEFVNVVEEFLEANPDAKLEDFLDQAALASDVDKLQEGDPFVTLMTVHLSKGLEFPAVFVTGMEEGLFPHARSLDKEDDIEEERRLCYVAMTRAKKKLFLSHANERRIFGTAKFNFPSRFLEDVPPEVVSPVGVQPNRMGATWSESDDDGYNPYASSSGTFRREVAGHASRSFGGYQNSRNTALRPSGIQRRPVAAATGEYIDRSCSQDHPILQQGMRVKHAVFGEGQVKSFEGSGDQTKVTVKFRSGAEKKLLFKHAHLQVL